ncbi:hypothetical protein CK203_081210 [Vitis vinifera]|uniref:Uncharacterized protein n=1 Tax=Vitis vinifera TaxID=29760 RepID=A0A438ERM2_VITVI|nr:hypothetical protein CK203_081210 [Vitis vinifera]
MRLGLGRWYSSKAYKGTVWNSLDSHRGFHLAAVRICRKPHRPRRLLSWLSGTRTLQSPDPSEEEGSLGMGMGFDLESAVRSPTTRSPALSACKCS